jgi:hypothetical protein
MSLSATTSAPTLTLTNHVILRPPGAALGATTTAPVLILTEIPTPSQRTFGVPAEERSFMIEAENRTFVVPAEGSP